MEHASLSDVPSHVAAGRVFPFDLYDVGNDPRLKEDTQKGLAFLHREAPDIFFTRYNGGHWTVTRHELMLEVLMNPDRFSSAQLGVPKTTNPQPLIPLSLDPPEHGPYRRILMRHFAPKAIARMENDIRNRAKALIENVAPVGQCDFLQQIGMPLPVQVFMDLMGLPNEKTDTFRKIVVEWFSIPNGPRRQEIAQTVIGHLREVISDRRERPRDDLVSALIAESIDGEPLSQHDIESMSFLLFLAGLDTVANAAGFMVSRLAQMRELQARLREDSSIVSRFIDETLRMSGVVTTARLVRHDTELGGVVLKAGDMVLCPLALAGLDERVNLDALEFRLERPAFSHLMFATGPHLCVGHFLARLELRILIEEWMRIIPEFTLDPALPREVKIGSMTAMLRLGIRWGTADQI